MKIDYNYKYILLSFLFTFIGSYISVCLSEQLRVNYRYFGGNKYSFKQRILILCFLSLTLGIISFWSMHYIYIYSISLQIINNIVNISNNDANDIYSTTATNTLSIRYIIISYVFSLITSILCTGFGYLYCFYDRFFGLSRKDIMEKFITLKKQTLSMREIRKIGNREIMRYLYFTSLNPILKGGVIMGCGVIGMQFIGESDIYNIMICL